MTKLCLETGTAAGSLRAGDTCGNWVAGEEACRRSWKGGTSYVMHIWFWASLGTHHVLSVDLFHRKDRSLALLGFAGGSDGEESACNAGDAGSIPGSGTSSGEGNGNPLQHPCLENPMDRGAWWATVHRMAKSWTPLSNKHTFLFTCSLGPFQTTLTKYQRLGHS